MKRPGPCLPLPCPGHSGHASWKKTGPSAALPFNTAGRAFLRLCLEVKPQLTVCVDHLYHPGHKPSSMRPAKRLFVLWMQKSGCSLLFCTRTCLRRFPPPLLEGTALRKDISKVSQHVRREGFVEWAEGWGGDRSGDPFLVYCTGS